jgi:hypothetical protein
MLILLIKIKILGRNVALATRFCPACVAFPSHWCGDPFSHFREPQNHEVVPASPGGEKVQAGAARSPWNERLLPRLHDVSRTISNCDYYISRAVKRPEQVKQMTLYRYCQGRAGKGASGAGREAPRLEMAEKAAIN